MRREATGGEKTRHQRVELELEMDVNFEVQRGRILE